MLYVIIKANYPYYQSGAGIPFSVDGNSAVFHELHKEIKATYEKFCPQIKVWELRMHPEWEVKVVDAQPSVIWLDLLSIHFLHLYWISSLTKEEQVCGQVNE